jgi:hypothetical protein
MLTASSAKSTRLCQHSQGQWYADTSALQTQPCFLHHSKVLTNDFGTKDVAVLANGTVLVAQVRRRLRDQCCVLCG